MRRSCGRSDFAFSVLWYVESMVLMDALVTFIFVH
jgi:hypothetical protein